MVFLQRFPAVSQILCLPQIHPIVKDVTLTSVSRSPLVELLPQFEVQKGTFHRVIIAAVQNLLFMMRVAKWKRAYSKGQQFSRKMQLPYFNRVRVGEDLTTELGKVIDETFPLSIDELADINSRCKELIEQLQDENASVFDLVELLDMAYEINVEAHERLGAIEFLPLSRPSSRTSSRANSQISLLLKPNAAALPMHQTGAMHLGVSALAAEKLAPQKFFFGDSEGFKFSVINNPDRLAITWPKAWGNDFLGAVVQNAQRLRDIEQDPTMVDFMTFTLADHLLSQGGNPFDAKKARFLGTVGFREYTQTYLSLTDPGDGHVFGTTRKSRWMKGAIVHVEHLERPQNLARDMIESYRVPSIFDFARVRLHTGYESPNTYFVGRALKDSGSFDYDFVKVVNTTSAAASAAFQLGSTECKIAMDGLAASQMVAYMRGMGGHSLKSHKQYLSAAFNLNFPLIDDLLLGEDGQPRKLVEQMDIGRRAIELAILGGFDKCTWDGASDTYPSKCIILQLGFQNALELVHRAHSAGLTTYMSAGFKFQHIADAVYAGVDGIGIGGAQILRYMDYDTGMHGPYTEEFIDQIQASRNEAANSIRGQGVALLCRLDYMHFELSITEAEESLRSKLYDALYAADEAQIKELMSTPAAQAARSLSSDGETPYLGRAKRSIYPRDGQHSLMRSASRGLLDGQNMWARIVNDLEGLLAINDDAGIFNYTTVAPWTTLMQAARNRYRPGEIYRTTYYTLKTTPYCGTV